MLILSSIVALQLQFDRPQLPVIDIPVTVTQQGEVLPARRGFVTEQPFSFALLQGTDKRLPFVLREYNADCLHYGHVQLRQPLTQKPQHASYQIDSNTCAYQSLEWQGKVTVKKAAGHLPKPIEQAPWQPQPPQLDNAEAPTVYGWAKLDKDGHIETHYNSQGNVAIPAYSLSKTFITANAALWLKKHNEANMNQQSIGAWVPECQQASWKSVTWTQALNMRTGHYDSQVHKADESAEDMINQFFLAESHADKIAYACQFPDKTNGGKQSPAMVYQSTASYLLSSAMQAYMQKHGLGHLDQLLYDSIWEPLQLSPLAYSINHTSDGQRQVWGGYGLSLLSSDLVKLASYVRMDPDQLGFAEILDNPDAATPVPGHNNLRYRHSIWFWQEPSSKRWIPFLSGYGGIMVVFLDQQYLYYLVSDQHDHRFAPVLQDFWRWQQQLAP